jgi:hypothetical protein
MLIGINISTETKQLLTMPRLVGCKSPGGRRRGIERRGTRAK